MSVINELWVVNRCLHAIGEAPINSVNANHPIVASALNSLYDALPTVLGQNWYFNTEKIQLYPNTDGNYQVPSDTIALIGYLNPPWVSTDGSLVYDNRIGAPLTGTGPITVVRSRSMVLDRMPFNAANYVSRWSVHDFLTNIDADENKIAKAENNLKDAYVTLNTEHIRAVQANQFLQGSAAQAGVNIRRPLNLDWRRY